MKIISTLTALVAVLFACCAAMAQENLTAKQIVERSFEATRLDGSEAISTMTIIDSKGRKRLRELAMVTKLYEGGDTEKKLMRFLSPPDVKGTGLLTFDYKEKDDDIWLYMPALRKTRRIISSEKAKSFMGSEFSYADINPPTLDNFTYETLGQKEIDGTPCWEIEMVPIDEEVADEYGFSRKISFIGQKDFVIRASVYYDLDEELHKELSVREIKEVDTNNHRYRPTYMVMVNKQNERKSILKINKIQFNPNVKDEYFTTRYLERE